MEVARRTRIDLVIFSLPISAEGRILQMLKKLWVLPVDIRLAAHNTSPSEESFRSWTRWTVMGASVFYLASAWALWG